MLRIITPIILVGIAVTSFLVFTNPIYQDIRTLRTEVSSYNQALTNSKALENERDKLAAKYNSIDPGNLEKIKKLLPDNIDNIRLILEIGQVASPYGMTLKNVKYSTAPETTNETVDGNNTIQGAVATEGTAQEYGVWDLEFSTEGSYNNFLNFLKDLESNLRIVDISSITFSSEVGDKLHPTSSDFYTYIFKIKTYWLKN